MACCENDVDKQLRSRSTERNKPVRTVRNIDNYEDRNSQIAEVVAKSRAKLSRNANA